MVPLHRAHRPRHRLILRFLLIRVRVEGGRGAAEDDEPNRGQEAHDRSRTDAASARFPRHGAQFRRSVKEEATHAAERPAQEETRAHDPEGRDLVGAVAH